MTAARAPIAPPENPTFIEAIAEARQSLIENGITIDSKEWNAQELEVLTTEAVQADVAELVAEAPVLHVRGCSRCGQPGHYASSKKFHSDEGVAAALPPRPSGQPITLGEVKAALRIGPEERRIASSPAASRAPSVGIHGARAPVVDEEDDEPDGDEDENEPFDRRRPLPSAPAPVVSRSDRFAQIEARARVRRGGG